jgi:5-methylcytosine-specific restriction endonuclease McrA
MGMPEGQATTAGFHLPIPTPTGPQMEAPLLMARKPQYAGPWRRIRREVLQRDNNQCQIKGEGCTQIAQQVDHILPVSMGGDWFEKDNLRASCARCNNNRNIKHRMTASRAW